MFFRQAKVATYKVATFFVETIDILFNFSYTIPIPPIGMKGA